MSKHTPGPWKATEKPYSDDGNKCRTFVISNHDGVLARVVGPFATIGKDQVKEANALLIAAAPDLLEALESVLKKMDELGCYEITEKENIMIKTAIAKSKGKV